jgi:hypothetical protein
MTEPAADPKPAADTLAGLDPAGLLRQGVDPAAPTATAPAPRWQPPTPAELSALLPQLEVGELIGQGGMGAVYRARQRHLDRSVALKILSRELGADPDFVARFAREAKALARLSHPNLVAIHDYGQTNGWCWLVMELVDGANLRQVMRTGRLSPQQALAIVPQLCDALQYAHDEGVVHRDIKPENILLDARGRVKIADFGLAKLRGEAPGGEALTGSGMVLGTVHYMAPEQVEGAKDVDHRADIYSLGVVFYEMLTGGLPLGRFEPPSRRIELDVRFDEVVLKALEKDPARRYQQASEVQTAVDGAQQAAPQPAKSKEGPGIHIGRLHIDDRGVRVDDKVVIDDQGIRIGGKRSGTRTGKDGRTQEVVDDDAVVVERSRYVGETVALVGGAMVAALLSMCQIHGVNLLTAPWPVIGSLLAAPLTGVNLMTAPWPVVGSLLAAPLMIFGGACLKARVAPMVAGLGCYAAVLPALWCWQHSWWLGCIASLAALWLISTVGGRRWDRHFAAPVRRLHVVLLILLAMAMVLVVVVGLMVPESERHNQAGERSATPQPAVLGRVQRVLRNHESDMRTTAAAMDSNSLIRSGPGSYEFSGATPRLPQTRRFVAHTRVRLQNLDVGASLKLWVHFADGSRYFTARALGPAADKDWHDVPLPFDASASSSTVEGLTFELLLPGAGRVWVGQPVLIEDVTEFGPERELSQF